VLVVAGVAPRPTANLVAVRFLADWLVVARLPLARG
jgi:hypothetical protein